MIITPFAYMATQAAAYDSDAQAFFTAVEGGGDTLTTTEKSAVNQLVLDLKADSIWTNILYAYPFVGGTASAHKWNLKDPQDTDAAYRLDFGTNISHNSSGIIGVANDGTKQSYADTHYNPHSAGATGHTIGMYYNQGLTATPNNWYDYGAYDNSEDNMISMGYNNKTTFYACWNGTSYKTTTAGTYGNSFFTGGNNGSTTIMFQDGVELASFAQTYDPVNLSLTLLANNRGGGPVATTGRGIGLAIAYDEGLDATEHNNLSTAVTDCMTTLGRD